MFLQFKKNYSVLLYVGQIGYIALDKALRAGKPLSTLILIAMLQEGIFVSYSKTIQFKIFYCKNLSFSSRSRFDLPPVFDLQ